MPARPTEAVAAVMHRGVIDVPPQATLQETAAEMAAHRVHCVVVDGIASDGDRQERLVWGILSDLDLMKAISDERLDADAGELAATEIVTVEETETIEQAAQLMADNDCAHLVVVARSGAPVGVISSLDVACAATLSSAGPAAV